MERDSVDCNRGTAEAKWIKRCEGISRHASLHKCRVTAQHTSARNNRLLLGKFVPAVGIRLPQY
jgi:hypothetical protein